MADKQWPKNFSGRNLKYNLWWNRVADPASIELSMIKHGGQWTQKNGELAGEGLQFHYKQFISIVWPWVVQHRWFDLILEKYLAHRTIVLIGPASSSKTFSSAICVLVDYFAHPDETTVLCCSTTRERLQDRVWAEMTKLFRMAKAERKWLPGNLIEGRLRIVTDNRLDSPDGRDFRNGCIGVSCKRGESFIGLGEFAGIKNKRVRLLGDELSLLPRSFVDSISNLDKNPDFKWIGMGNPKDTTDALGVIGEPAERLGGWESGIDQTPGTKTWPIRRDGGIAIQLPGDDSPNLDGSLGIPLISQVQIDRDVSFYGRDSLWFSMMNQGRMPRGQGTRRVLTRQMCVKFHAMEEPIWRDSNLKHIGFLDAAYRGVGGDRCIFGELVFGYESVASNALTMDSSLANSASFNRTNRQVIALVETMVVPINPSFENLPEDQIVSFVMDQCKARGITPENFFFDSGMRTSLVSAFSRVWSPEVQSVDCGGTPTDAPVSGGIRVPSKDYYSKKITQIWFSVRLAVEAGQVRGFTEDVIMEFSSREWTVVGANKIEVEPKAKMKEKIGRSPDLADAVAVGIFGACQRGFQIAQLLPVNRQNRGRDWRDDLRAKEKKIWASGQLEYATISGNS